MPTPEFGYMPKPALSYGGASDWMSRPSGQSSVSQPGVPSTSRTGATQQSFVAPGDSPSATPDPRTGGGGTEAPVGGGTTAPPVNTRGMTFAQLQAAGQARPAPPPPPAPAPQAAYQPSQFSQQVNPQLMQSVLAMLGTPSGYNDSNVQGAIARNRDRLNQQYDTSMRQTNEELARRGIYDSTIAGARYGDLNAERSRQDSEFTGNLLDSYAKQMQADRASAINSALSLSNSMNEQNARDFQLSTAAQQQNYENLLSQYTQQNQGYEADRNFYLDSSRLDYDAIASLLDRLNGTTVAGADPATVTPPNTDPDPRPGLPPYSGPLPGNPTSPPLRPDQTPPYPGENGPYNPGPTRPSTGTIPRPAGASASTDPSQRSQQALMLMSLLQTLGLA